MSGITQDPSWVIWLEVNVMLTHSGPVNHDAEKFLWTKLYRFCFFC